MEDLLLSEIKEIKCDIKEIKKSVTNLEYFKAQVLGGCIAISFLFTMLLNFYKG